MSAAHAVRRTAIVSGASRGIGLAVTQALVSSGFRVAMLARGASELEARARELGSTALPIPCDVGDAEAIARTAATARAEFGAAPDVIVSNAGLFRLAPVEQISPDDFKSALDVNVVAPFLLARAFVGEMRARGHGHIVAIGSIADHVVYPENGAYAASKHALRALHEALRAELRGSGVRVTLVSPEPVDTPLWDPVDPDRRAGFTPRSRMLPAAAVAAAVLYAVGQPPEVNVDALRLSRS